MSSVAILQARTDSTRLPGKVLLPVGGMPLAVLAAKRAGNSGRTVIVATSEERTDDYFAQVVESHGLPCFRGSLANPLNRLVGALADLNDDTLVFRLTGDNVFPDGALLDEMARQFIERRYAYLACNGEGSGLPYGMSVEVTLLRHLREADREASLAHDQEHVTPYIIRKYGANFFDKYRGYNKGLLRCTVDCLDDYLAVAAVFAGVSDPVGVPALDLIAPLAALPSAPSDSGAVPRLVYGAAQLGSNYGIANRTAQPTKEQCAELLKTSVCNGVAYLDTARAYGNSEEMIGHALKNGLAGRVKVITKLAPLTDCLPDAPASSVRAFVDASLFQSLATLGVGKLDVLMLHRASHLTDWDGSAWQRLLHWQSTGLLGALGVSVQSPEELAAVLAIPAVAYIQLPFNLLDWRWDEVIPQLLAIKQSRKLTVHVRSALLQGLLGSSDAGLWSRAHVDDALPVTDWLAAQVTAFQRCSLGDLCLNYVNALPWVDGIAVGMEHMDQLATNLEIFRSKQLTATQVAQIQGTRPRLSAASLNPATWRSAT